MKTRKSLSPLMSGLMSPLMSPLMSGLMSGLIRKNRPPARIRGWAGIATGRHIHVVHISHTPTERAHTDPKNISFGKNDVILLAKISFDPAENGLSKGLKNRSLQKAPMVLGMRDYCAQWMLKNECPLAAGRACTAAPSSRPSFRDFFDLTRWTAQKLSARKTPQRFTIQEGRQKHFHPRRTQRPNAFKRSPVFGFSVYKNMKL